MICATNYGLRNVFMCTTRNIDLQDRYCVFTDYSFPVVTPSSFISRACTLRLFLHKSHQSSQSETDSAVNSKAVSPFDFQQQLDTLESRIDQEPHLIEEVANNYWKVEENTQ